MTRKRLSLVLFLAVAGCPETKRVPSRPRVFISSPASAAPVRIPGEPIELARVDLSPRGDLALLSARDGKSVWVAAWPSLHIKGKVAGYREATLQPDEERRSVWHSDGGSFVTAGPASLRTWDAKTFAPLPAFADDASCLDARVSFSPDEQALLAMTCHGRLQTWATDPWTTSSARSLYPKSQGHRAVIAWRPLGHIAVVDEHVVDAVTGDDIGELPTSYDAVLGESVSTTSVAWMPDGTAFVAAMMNGDVALRSPKGDLLKAIRRGAEGDEGPHAAFRADGSQFVVVAADDVRTYTPDGRHQRTGRWKTRTGAGPAEYSSDGSYVAWSDGSYREGWIWETDGQTPPRRVCGSLMGAPRWSSSRRQLLCRGERDLVVWDVDKKTIATIPIAERWDPAGFSRDGTALVVATSGNLVIANLITGKQARVATNATSPSLHLTRDGSYAVVVGGDVDVIRLRDGASVWLRFDGVAFTPLEGELPGFPSEAD